MDEVATVLRRERWLLSVLLFRLTEMRHLLAANDARFLGWASAEVEEVVTRVREAELMRAALITRIAREMEMGESELTLAALSRVAAEPYRQIFSEHRSAILEHVEEVQTLSQVNRRLAACGLQGIQDVLVVLDDVTDTTLEVQLAQTGYQSALAAAASLALPTLVAFLG